MVSGIRHLPYGERLRALNLPSLYYHRKRADITLVYKIFHGLVDVNSLTFFLLLLITSPVATTTRFLNLIQLIVQDHTFSAIISLMIGTVYPPLL